MVAGRFQANLCSECNLGAGEFLTAAYIYMPPFTLNTWPVI
jgi:hypothetical protein